MRKALIISLVFLLAATAATTARAEEAAVPEANFEADLNLGAGIVRTDKNAAAASKDQYLHSSGAGSLNLEWDPLPHRLLIDANYLNRKDYFADIDYAWRDVVVVNVLSRGLFRNREHLDIGADDLTTALPSFTDRSLGDEYGFETSINKAFLRLKMPDFPLHVYAEARQVDRDGTFQQRYLNISDLFPPAKTSVSRTYETKTTEVTVGANSHLGPMELDYSHAEKKTDVSGDKVLTDTSSLGTSYKHNQIPDLESSADSVKIHTSLTGRLVASATYTSGDKKNKDSDSKADYSMAAGDVTYIPINDLSLFLKYRHYDLENTNPDTVTASTLSGTTTYNVRDSISTKRDNITGTARYRVTENFSIKAEYDVEAYQRDVGTYGTNLASPPANTSSSWDLPKETTTNTERLGIVYRILRTMLVRADYRHSSVDNPAYDTDPDTGDYAKATLTWTPARALSFAFGYNGTREKRDYKDLSLIGRDRKVSRDQAFGSATLLIGKRTSVTAAYSYFKNNVEQGLVFLNNAWTEVVDNDVPYTDRSQSGSLSVTHSPMDGVALTLEATRSTGKGSYHTSGAVSGSDGIADLSDTDLVEDEYTAEIDVQYTKELGYQIKYQYLDREDKIDNTLDGTAQLLLATLSVKW